MLTTCIGNIYQKYKNQLHCYKMLMICEVNMLCIFCNYKSSNYVKNQIIKNQPMSCLRKYTLKCADLTDYSIMLKENVAVKESRNPEDCLKGKKQIRQ